MLERMESNVHRKKDVSKQKGGGGGEKECGGMGGEREGGIKSRLPLRHTESEVPDMARRNWRVLGYDQLIPIWNGRI